MKIFLSFVLALLINSVSCNRVHLTCAQKRAFIDGHNTRRYQVAQGTVHRQPSAGDMKYMVWDEELAEKAARWAENGVFGHNPDRTIGSKRWYPIGENVFVSKYYSNIPGVYGNVIPNIEEALDSWFGEHKDYGFGPFNLGSAKPTGHYTQMVWADSTRVGCGISQRKEHIWTTSTLFVCNYGPTGNFLGRHPYKYEARRGFLQCARGECYRPYGMYC